MGSRATCVIAANGFAHTQSETPAGTRPSRGLVREASMTNESPELLPPGMSQVHAPITFDSWVSDYC